MKNFKNLHLEFVFDIWIYGFLLFVSKQGTKKLDILNFGNIRQISYTYQVAFLEEFE